MPGKKKTMAEEPTDAGSPPGKPGHQPSRMDTMPEAFAQLLTKSRVELGSVIGNRYRLVAALADGAMGQVFVAQNVAINMRVAVKLLKPDLIANPDFRKRFQQEAQAIAAIEHPNVARFLDLIVGDPTFLVMEYVRGQTLAEVLRAEQRLTPARAVAIAIRLCWGLDAAHAAGVIHRDLKPGNIILSESNELGETPKIIDFGLAKLATSTSSAQLTRTGQIVGTPEYMPPEQIAGKEVNARADVYSLGCVLYEMIAGRTPFGGGFDDVQILYRQLHEPPPSLSTVVPETPAQLDRVLARALAKRPEDRYESMREFAEALERSMKGERRPTAPPARAASASPPSVPPPVTRVRAAPMIVGATLAAVAGVLGGMLLERSGTSHAVVIADAAPAPVRASGEDPQLLVLTTKPAGASVELDGVWLGETTPTAVRGIAAGPHTVRFRRDGRADMERKIVIEPGARSTIDLVLPPASRDLLVRTVPSSAMIYLDGQLVGSSPATLQVTDEDFHELRAEKIGFEPHIETFGPEDRAPELVLTLELEKHPRAEIIVDFSESAEIWLDGNDTGLEAPMSLLRVTAGKHTVQLRDSTGARSKLVTVDARVGETVRLMLNLPTKK